jgi:hypothetical protein
MQYTSGVQTDIDGRIVIRECGLALKIVIPLLIAAIVVSLFAFGAKIVIAAAFASFALMMMISLPLWLASIEGGGEAH